MRPVFSELPYYQSTMVLGIRVLFTSTLSQIGFVDPEPYQFRSRISKNNIGIAENSFHPHIFLRSYRAFLRNTERNFFFDISILF